MSLSRIQAHSVSNYRRIEKQAKGSDVTTTAIVSDFNDVGWKVLLQIRKSENKDQLFVRDINAL